LEFGTGKKRAAETRHLRAEEPGAIAAAAELLRQGHLVVFPTDTLYGIGANAFNAEAITRLYQVKARPQQKGIPILLSDLHQLQNVIRDIPDMAIAYYERYWPGPLTLIMPKHRDLPAVISPNEGVAVRIPDNDVTRALIRAAGGMVATSSANRSGQRPARTGADAMRLLGGQVSAVLDDGPCPEEVASTIIDCLGKEPVIIREGPILAADLFPAASLRP
jgi:L-threonylcarbamoyladenylate synthase